MSERTDHPPSTNEPAGAPTPGRTVRRALFGGVLGLALLIGPVALATVVLPDDNAADRVEAAGSDSETSLISARRVSLSMRDKDRALGLLRITTTTTTAPPTTTTTAPPTTTTTEPPTTTTEPPPATEPPPPPPPDSGGGLGDPNSYATWDALAECESGGNWQINTGNGYYGGLQFSLSTWQAVGGTEFAPYPHEASREQQIIAGQRLYASSGWGAWPACTAELGWR